MKKIDLHLHTIPTIWDADFKFDIVSLINYVENLKIDCIAITNHNRFDYDQFNIILSHLNIKVLPGIEITIGQGRGHIIIIADLENVIDFSDKCKKIEEEIVNIDGYIPLNLFKSIFTDLNQYLIIPHIDKYPIIDVETQKELSTYLHAAEVSSVKKFQYLYKDKDALTPVIFSDLRLSSNLESFSNRQTYFDIDEINVKTLQNVLKDKHKISLSKESGHKLFQVLENGLEISTGLNVIVGSRSSGKSYTLDQINESNEKVKYIKQFDLLEIDPIKKEDEFNTFVSNSQARITETFLNEFKNVVDEVVLLSIEDDNSKVERYIESLKKYASETEKSDAFSNCKLFTETLYQEKNTDQLHKIITATETILDSVEYRELIETKIKRSDMLSLHGILVDQIIRDKEEILKRTWVNSLITNIKTKLQSRTAAPRVEDVDFLNVLRNQTKIRVFERIALEIRKDRTFFEEDLINFKKIGNLTKMNSAQDLKDHSHSRLAFTSAFQKYDEPFQFLKELQKITGLENSTYYQYFTKAKFQVLNEYGFPVSGGERAEFNLLKEIQDALQYDILLIDEPESSFDNLFLKDHVNNLLKNISKEMPVVIVTHNNTVGVTVMPDYLLFTKRIISSDGVCFKIYRGYPTSEKLISMEGDEILNHITVIDCLEAGIDAYVERRQHYEIFKN